MSEPEDQHLVVAVARIDATLGMVLDGLGRIETVVDRLDKRQQSAEIAIALQSQALEQHKAQVARELGDHKEAVERELKAISERHEKEDDRKTWVTYGQPLGSLVGVVVVVVGLILYLYKPGP